MKKLSIIILLILLAACVRQAPQSYDKVEEEYYILKGLDRPKHFYVDLQNVKTGKMYNVYVSKHCNAWRELRIGAVYRLNRYYWTYEGREYADFESCNLQQVFCKSCK